MYRHHQRLSGAEVQRLPAETVEVLHRTMDEITAYREKAPRRPRR